MVRIGWATSKLSLLRVVTALLKQNWAGSVDQGGHSEKEAGEEPANANDSGVVHDEAAPIGARQYQTEHYRNIAEG